MTVQTERVYICDGCGEQRPAGKGYVPLPSGWHNIKRIVMDENQWSEGKLDVDLCEVCGKRWMALEDVFRRGKAAGVYR